jgi:glycosyltransferase involved in cell wall biosynthesis
MQDGTGKPKLRFALVHDFLLDLRGAERVFAALCDIYPDADIFTAVYDPKGTHGRFANRRVHTTFLQRLRPTAKTFRALMPAYPYAIESLDLRGYDVVISSHSAWSHGVIPDERAIHVCYCHNPFRYAWNAREETLHDNPALLRAPLAMVLGRWRQWDTTAARRVDRYIANSETTRQRVLRYFGRSSEIIPPPVETDRFSPVPLSEVGREYAVLSELMPHKRIDVAVRAFNRMGLPLVIIGKGPDSRRLQRLAGPTIRFAGRIDDEEVAHTLARCRGLVVTATEEFGIAAVEAQAAGRPVIALRAGGVAGTVVEGQTGVFFDEPEPDALIAAVRGFDALSVDPAACVANARRFDVSSFQRGIERVVNETLRGELRRTPRSTLRRSPPRRARGLVAPR